jgi:hypothetical protein
MVVGTTMTYVVVGGLGEFSSIIGLYFFNHVTAFRAFSGTDFWIYSSVHYTVGQ